MRDSGRQRKSVASKGLLQGLLRDSTDTWALAHSVVAPDESGVLYTNPELELVFPIGHFAGPMYTRPDAEAPESFEVRFRSGVFSLSAEEYAIWAVAHGDPQHAGVRATTRTLIEHAASEAGVDEPKAVFDSLVEDKLLAVTTVRDDRLRNFARLHQIRPLALGLGNSPANPAEFQIGLPNAARVSVGYDVYHMWLFAHREASLWDAVSVIATEAMEANDDDDSVKLVDDPDVLLSALFRALPVLISTSCVYIDRVA